MDESKKVNVSKPVGTTRIIEKSYRSLLKSFSWRILASITTITIAYFITGDVSSALEIGGIEFILKMFIYYAHERFWNLLKVGQTIEEMPPPEYQI